jgi:hypothetical protein
MSVIDVIDEILGAFKTPTSLSSVQMDTVFHVVPSRARWKGPRGNVVVNALYYKQEGRGVRYPIR